MKIVDHHDNEHVGRVVAILLLVHLAHLNIVALECVQNYEVKCTSKDKHIISEKQAKWSSIMIHGHDLTLGS